MRTRKRETLGEEERDEYRDKPRKETYREVHHIMNQIALMKNEERALYSELRRALGVAERYDEPRPSIRVGRVEREP